MAKRDDLFDLINSMSKSEKRYFKVVASQHTVKGKNKYVLLFDLINKQSDYNEKEIKASITDKMLKKNFAVEKNYLYNFLLKTLTSFHSQKSLNAKASNSIYTIRLLISKALDNQSSKLIEKTIKFAEQSENYTLLLELLKLKIEYLESTINNSKIQGAYERIFEIQKIHNNVTQYRYLHHLLYEVLTFLGKKPLNNLIIDAEKILNNELFQSEEMGLCNESKIRFNESWGLFYYLKKDFHAAFKHSERTLEIIEDAPLVKQEKQNSYISYLNNYIIFSSAIRQFDKSQEKISILKSFITKDATNRNNINIFVSTALYETNYFLSTNQFEEIYTHIDEYEEGLKLFESKMLLSRKYGLFFNISILYFVCENYNLALKWINKIIHYEEPPTRTDMLGFAWLFNLLIHFELKNYDYIDYLMKSTMRYINNKQQLVETTKAIIKLIRILVKKVDENKRKEAIISCLSTLNSDDCRSEIIEGEYLEIKLWVQSKLENVPYAKLLTEYNNSLN